jgi:nitrogen regulatory protein PII
MTLAEEAKEATLLIAMVAHGQGEPLVKTAKKNGAKGATIAPGRCFHQNRLLNFLGLAKERQDVVLSLLGPEISEVSRVLKAEDADKGKKGGRLSGLALTLKAIGFSKSLSASPEPPKSPKERGAMDHPYQLITAILNQGLADEVMAVARKAGAEGGTVITARGTGTEEDIKFFGLTLVPEKEVLFIVAESSKSPAILEAIRRYPGLSAPGLGILFASEVESLFWLGQADS